MYRHQLVGLKGYSSFYSAGYGAGQRVNQTVFRLSSKIPRQTVGINGERRPDNTSQIVITKTVTICLQHRLVDNNVLEIILTLSSKVMFFGYSCNPDIKF